MTFLELSKEHPEIAAFFPRKYPPQLLYVLDIGQEFWLSPAERAAIDFVERDLRRVVEAFPEVPLAWANDWLPHHAVIRKFFSSQDLNGLLLAIAYWRLIYQTDFYQVECEIAGHPLQSIAIEDNQYASAFELFAQQEAARMNDGPAQALFRQFQLKHTALLTFARVLEFRPEVITFFPFGLPDPAEYKDNLTVQQRRRHCQDANELEYLYCCLFPEFFADWPHAPLSIINDSMAITSTSMHEEWPLFGLLMTAAYAENIGYKTETGLSTYINIYLETVFELGAIPLGWDAVDLYMSTVCKDHEWFLHQLYQRRREREGRGLDH